MRAKRCCTVIALTVLGTTNIAWGQNQTVPRLVATDVHEVPQGQRWGMLALPVKCDPDGNLYLHERQARGGSLLVRVSADGTQITKFDFDSIENLKNAWLSDFSVVEDGEIFGLLKSGGAYTIAQFSKDGTFSGKENLSPDLPANITQLVALHGGTFFVSGTDTGKEDPKLSGAPFNALYDQRGGLLKQVRFRSDSAKQGKKATADPAGNSNLAITLGNAVAGDDGNIYVLRLSSPALVYVVSPSGQPQRRLRVASPTSSAEPISLAVSRGRVAIVFDDPNAKDASNGRVRVVDSQNGKLVSDYRLSKELGEVLGCFVENTFTFWRADSGLLRIVQASPQ